MTVTAGGCFGPADPEPSRSTATRRWTSRCRSARTTASATRAHRVDRRTSQGDTALALTGDDAAANVAAAVRVLLLRSDLQLRVRRTNGHLNFLAASTAFSNIAIPAAAAPNAAIYPLLGRPRRGCRHRVDVDEDHRHRAEPAVLHRVAQRQLLQHGPDGRLRGAAERGRRRSSRTTATSAPTRASRATRRPSASRTPPARSPCSTPSTPRCCPTPSPSSSGRRPPAGQRHGHRRQRRPAAGRARPCGR